MVIHNPILTGSFTVNNIDVSSITSSAANITALNAATASLNSFSASVLSYTASQNILNGTYTLTSSFNAQTASLNSFSASVLTFTGSAATRLGALETYTSSLNNKTSSFATTGSNTFIGSQVVSGSIVQSGSFTTTGTIIAQTINVQQVTSSVIYSSGSNIFGNLISNTQVFTGSVLITGSLALAGNITGSNITLTGTLNGTSGNFSSFVYVGNGNPLRIYNTGNGDYGNLTFATATGFAFDKSACFNGVVCASTIKVGADTTLNDRNLTFAGYPTSVCFGNGQSIYDNGAGGLAIGSQAGIQLIASGSYAVNITPAGNVGIGTTTPCRELHARGEILFQARSGSIANNSMYRFIPRSTDRAFQFQLMSDSTALETTVWSVCRNDQTVTSFNIENGSVGIGTCAPESKLHIYNANNPLSIKIQRTTVPVFLSDVQLAGTTAGAVWSHNLENTSNGSVSWGGFGNTVYAGSAIMLNSDTSTSYITLHTAPSVNTNPTERLRIGGAGTFGFNCSGVAARTMVVKGVTGCYIVAEFIEPAGVHSIEIYPNKNSTNHISSDYMSGGVYLPLSLSGRECSTDLVLGTNGRVGIGTSTPADKLHVSNGGAEGFEVGFNTGQVTMIGYNRSTSAYIPLILQGGGGSVGIGATPANAKLLVYDTGCTVSLGISCFYNQARGIDLFNANSGTTDNVIGYWISTGPHKVGIASGRTNAASTWEVDLRFYTHPTTIGGLDTTCENMRLYGDGSLVTRGGTSSPGLYSDINLKENLSIIPSALNKIQCINGYTFDWKDTSPARSNPDLLNIIHDAGLIAQEVESILPDIVRNNDLSCTKMLNYNGITALLVEGMKEQQCIINTLKTCLGIA